MPWSDDQAHFDAWGYDAFPTRRPERPVAAPETAAKRLACGYCGNSITFHALACDEGWVFECRRCGQTTRFTDAEMASQRLEEK